MEPRHLPKHSHRRRTIAVLKALGLSLWLWILEACSGRQQWAAASAPSFLSAAAAQQRSARRLGVQLASGSSSAGRGLGSLGPISGWPCLLTLVAVTGCGQRIRRRRRWRLAQASLSSSAEAVLSGKAMFHNGPNATLDVTDNEYQILSSSAFKVLKQLREERQPHGPLTFDLLNLWKSWEQHGLPKDFWKRPAETEVVRLHRPTAEELNVYVKRNQPVVITGALDSDNFPPLQNFNDLDYLRHRCGSRLVDVQDADVEVDGDGRQVFISGDFRKVTFDAFLTDLENAEQNRRSPQMYMRKNRVNDFAPELIKEMDAASGSPLKRYGSCFGANLGGRMDMGVHMYFGCGQNSVGVHSDLAENLLAVVSGTKRFDLYHPADADCLYVNPRSPFTCTVPPFVDPDGMPESLASRCPLYRNARPIRVDLEAGEMLYLPMLWWHCVTGSVERNMILTWWCDISQSKAERVDKSTGAQAALAGMTYHDPYIEKLEDAGQHCSDQGWQISFGQGNVLSSQEWLRHVSFAP